MKAAVFAAGGGRIGDYDSCCFQLRGQGQFRPLAGSDPFLGEVGELEQVEEVRVELVCSAEHIAATVAALKTAHPYETPAFDVVQLSAEFSA